MRGHDLQPLVAGAAADWPQEVFLQISESQCGRAIRTGKWKYSVCAPDVVGSVPASAVYAEQYLYDLEADPHERCNRVADPALAGVRAELAQTLKRRMAEAGEAEPVILPAR
jgi:arylsulfatase A-like enzyme